MLREFGNRTQAETFLETKLSIDVCHKPHTTLPHNLMGAGGRDNYEFLQIMFGDPVAVLRTEPKLFSSDS